MTDFSYQLYSSRNFGPIDKTLSMLAAQGYTQVEGYGALFSSQDEAKKLKDALDQNGLEMPTAHLGLEFLEDTPDEALAIAKIIGLKAGYVPFLQSDARPDTADGWQQIGARAQKALNPLKDAGMDIGWHNHEFEFAALNDGSLPMDAILKGGPDLKAELDLAWVAVAGLDPVSEIARLANRVSSVHLKDIAPKGECADEDGWADVGHGTMDFAAIKKAVDASSCQFLVVEHDNPKDDQRFAARSIATTQKIWNT